MDDVLADALVEEHSRESTPNGAGAVSVVVGTASETGSEPAATTCESPQREAVGDARRESAEIREAEKDERRLAAGSGHTSSIRRAADSEGKKLGDASAGLDGLDTSSKEPVVEDECAVRSGGRSGAGAGRVHACLFALRVESEEDSRGEADESEGSVVVRSGEADCWEPAPAVMEVGEIETR